MTDFNALGGAAQANAPTPQINPAQGASEQVNPALAAQQAQGQHHTILGRLAENLLLGGQTQYSAGPDGQVTSKTVTPKPGQLFSSIVRGALLGAAAGQGTPDFATGFARGGGAAVANSQQQDQERYARAQQDVENQRQQADLKMRQNAEQRAQAQANDEHILHQYQVAQYTQELYKSARDLDMQSPDAIKSLNTAGDGLRQSLEQGGGKVADISIPTGGGQWANDTEGNPSGFADVYAKNPGKFRAPNGYEYVAVQTSDNTGLHYDQHFDPASGQVTNRWLDKDGKPVDMDGRAKLTVMQVPVSWFSEIKPYDGNQLLKMNPNLKGAIDPTHTYNLNGSQVVGMVNDGVKQVNQTTTADAARMRSIADKIKADTSAAGKTPSEKLRALDERRKIYSGIVDQLSKNPQDDPDGSKLRDANFALQTIDSMASAIANPTPPPAGSELIKPPKAGAFLTPDQWQQYVKANGGDENKAGDQAKRDGWAFKPNPNSNQPSLQVGQQVPLKDGRMVTVTKVYQNGTFDYK